MKVAYFILNRFDVDSRARLEVETLKSAGYTVDVVATAGGQENEFAGCPIHRIPQHTWPSRKIRFFQYNLKAASLGAKLDADIYHAVDLDTLYAAYRGSKKNKAKLIYESRELYTELEALSGRGLVRRFWTMVENALIGKAHRIITINDSIADELVRRYSVARPEIILNVAALSGRVSAIDLYSKLKIPADHKILIYQGVLRRGQGLTYLLELIAKLERTTLVLVGDGHIKSELADLADILGINNRVKFAGMVPPDDLIRYTVSGHSGVLLMEDVALNNRLALPQKLFQYLAAGIPQIVSGMPEISGLVEREKTGVTLGLEDVDRDAAIVSEFLRDEGRYSEAKANCLKAAEKYNWEIESRKLVKLYRDLEG